MSGAAKILACVAAGCGAIGLSACGSDTIDVRAPADRRGAELFAANCGGCHTLKAAGTQGSNVRVSNKERVDGPNFDVRKETASQVLYAIRNGGFSGAIMPENILVGRDALAVARFLAKYSGSQTDDTAGGDAK